MPAPLPDDSVNLPQTHALRDAAELSVVVAVLMLVIYLVVAYFVELAVWLMPVGLEARIARGLIEQLDTELERGRDRQHAELGELVRRLGDRVQRHRLSSFEDVVEQTHVMSQFFLCLQPHPMREAL